ncbi:MAG: hypothetical protein ACRDGS_16995 [Chloroflexota bacterium]
MREVTYKVMPAIGGSNTTKKHGTLLDLVLAIPYLVVDVIPPLKVLNSVLRTGVYDAGMSGGCSWRHIEIDQKEYSELVEAILTLPHRNIVIDTQFTDCTDFSEWTTKRFEEWANNTPDVTRTPDGGWRREHPSS